MKNIIKSILLGIMMLSVTSCLLDDDSLTKSFDDGPNFASFSTLNQPVSAVANGNEVTANVNMELQGPTLDEFSEDVVATISVDASSTAIEGVHYRLNSSSVTFTKDQNYIAVLPITIITQGITPPLATAPTLILSISSAQGTNIIPNSKKTTLSLIYQCFC